jgi:hypothetical protein
MCVACGVCRCGHAVKAVVARRGLPRRPTPMIVDAAQPNETMVRARIQEWFMRVVWCVCRWSCRRVVAARAS